MSLSIPLFFRDSLQDNEIKNVSIVDGNPSERKPISDEVETTIEKHEAPSSNRRIAKNALMLYIRMFLTMIVGLYTSRVVLNTLGVEDYGIYGVVGGVVSMLGFINASMSGATSRFLTFELGRGDKKRLKDTFSSALIVHIGIALVVFVVAETVGLWFLTHKLVIPDGRMTAAHWVYQCSIISAMLGITQAPYNATIIAHEKMDIYAYVEILNVTLKLLIVYLLVIGNFDKLILYSILVLAVSMLIMMVYRIYCIRHFPESHFHWIWNPSILRPLMNFSWQTLIGHLSFSFRQQGINFALNMIFGVIVNAASGVASTLSGIISQFSHTILAAFNPQIVKRYASGDTQSACKLIISAARFSTLLLLLIIIPFEFETELILQLWLGTVPEYTVTFTRLMMLSILTCVTNPIYVGLTATGNIKAYSFIQASIYVLVPFVSYLLCLYFENPDIAYLATITAQIFASIIVVIILKNNVPIFRISMFLFMILKTLVFPSILSIVACYLIYRQQNQSLIRLLTVSATNAMVLGVFSYYSLPKTSRLEFFSQVKILLFNHKK